MPELYIPFIEEDQQAKSALEDLKPFADEVLDRNGRMAAYWTPFDYIDPITKSPVENFYCFFQDKSKDKIRISFKRMLLPGADTQISSEDGGKTWTFFTTERTKSPITFNENETTIEDAVKSAEEMVDVSYFHKMDKEKIKRYTSENEQGVTTTKSYTKVPVVISFSNGKDKFGDKLLEILGINQEMSGLAKALRFIWGFLVARKSDRYANEWEVMSHLFNNFAQKELWGKKINPGKRYFDVAEMQSILDKPKETLTDEEKNDLGLYNILFVLSDIRKTANFMQNAYYDLGLKVDPIKGRFFVGERSRGAVIDADQSQIDPNIIDSKGNSIIGVKISPVFNTNENSVLSATIKTYQLEDSDFNLSEEEFRKKVSELPNVKTYLKKELVSTGIQLVLSKREDLHYQIGSSKLWHSTDLSKPVIYFTEFFEKDAFKRLLIDDKGAEPLMNKIFNVGQKRLYIENERVSAAFIFNLIKDFNIKLSARLKGINGIPNWDKDDQNIIESLKFAINKNRESESILKVLSITNPDLYSKVATIAQGPVAAPQAPVELAPQAQAQGPVAAPQAQAQAPAPEEPLQLPTGGRRKRQY